MPTRRRPFGRAIGSGLLLVLGALLAWFLVESAAGWGFYEG
jgi:hypothetical protein